MSKLTMPHDRTEKQPIVAYCTNIQCLVGGERFEFPAAGSVVCPKCGATESPMIGLLTLVHFMVRDNKHGPIRGAVARFKLACDPKREHLATATNLEAATDQLVAVNCPKCLAVAKEQKLAPVQGTPVMPNPQDFENAKN